MKVGQTPAKASLVATLNRFASMGLEVAYSELDIAQTRLPSDAPAQPQQARAYVTVVESCLAVQKRVGIYVWEFTDKYSWIPSTFPGQGEACLFNANFTKKPAYTSVASLLAAATAAPAQQAVDPPSTTQTGSLPTTVLASGGSSVRGMSSDGYFGGLVALGVVLLAAL